MSKQNWDAELYEARHSFVWQFGKGLIDILKPQPGERILDIGCGPGQLTAVIAESGAQVVGLDSSLEMIGQARQNFPKLSFVLENVVNMRYEAEFDALFSNAALHWVLDAEAASKAMARALRPGGRFVVELGGSGNIQSIERAIVSTLASYAPDYVWVSNNYFPSMGQYTALLENAGLEVRSAELYDRPTKLDSDNGMENWIRQFKWFYFDAIPVARREQALAHVIEDLRPKLWNSQGWFADYRRLRIVAMK